MDVELKIKLNVYNLLYCNFSGQRWLRKLEEHIFLRRWLTRHMMSKNLKALNYSERMPKLMHIYFLLQKLCKWMTQLLLAVDYLHTNRVLHRDIKVCTPVKLLIYYEESLNIILKWSFLSMTPVFQHISDKWRGY